ncbi:MAG: SIMPL domain-containing protein [Bacteroidota bacterium]
MKLNSRITAAIISGLALIMATLLITSTWRSGQQAQQTLTVIGSAKMDMVSDMGVLRGSINTMDIRLADAITAVMRQQPRVAEFLAAKGIKPQQVEWFPPTSYGNNEFTAQGFQTGRILNYSVSQRFQVKVNDTKRIKDIAMQLTELIASGINLQMETPEYYYSKLSDVKINIQAEAARDAQNRAERIASATGQKLGKLRSARMGVIQITPKNSNVVSDYGINDVTSVQKEITAVVHASFEID